MSRLPDRPNHLPTLERPCRTCGALIKRDHRRCPDCRAQKPVRVKRRCSACGHHQLGVATCSKHESRADVRRRLKRAPWDCTRCGHTEDHGIPLLPFPPPQFTTR